MIRKIEMLFGLILVSSTLILGCTGTLMAKNSGETMKGKRWFLATMNGEKIPENLKIYAEFICENEKTECHISGFGGCNMFRGAANITDKNIKVQHVSSTRKACKTPENVMKTEAKFLKVLESATTYDTKTGGLEIMDASGNKILSFMADK